MHNSSTLSPATSPGAAASRDTFVRSSAAIGRSHGKLGRFAAHSPNHFLFPKDVRFRRNESTFGRQFETHRMFGVAAESIVYLSNCCEDDQAESAIIAEPKDPNVTFEVTPVSYTHLTLPTILRV